MRNTIKKWATPAVLSALLFMPQLASAQEATPAESKPVDARKLYFPQGVLFPYVLLDGALQGRIDKSGNVDYLALKGNQHLEFFVLATQTADLSAFPVWTVKDKEGKETQDRSAELVFWINAYNAHFLKTVSDAYPIKDVSEIKNLYSAKTHVISGQAYSLQELREKITKMDPRAYFALTDGTVGGPMLAPVAYRLTGLNELLDAAVSNFVNDQRNLELTRIQDEVRISEAFKEVDPYFETNLKRGKWSGIRYVLLTYTTHGATRKYFTTNDFRIEFKPKDNTFNNKNL